MNDMFSAYFVVADGSPAGAFPASAGGIAVNDRLLRSPGVWWSVDILQK